MVPTQCGASKWAIIIWPGLTLAILLQLRYFVRPPPHEYRWIHLQYTVCKALTCRDTPQFRCAFHLCLKQDHITLSCSKLLPPNVASYTITIRLLECSESAQGAECHRKRGNYTKHDIQHRTQLLQSARVVYFLHHCLHTHRYVQFLILVVAGNGDLMTKNVKN